MPKLTQQQLLDIFNALKAVMKPYEKGSIKARINIEGKYDLWSEKKGMQILGKTRDEMSFATIILQSNYVGFYYMPVYCEPEQIGARLDPVLMKMLKGKACFHIKKIDEGVVNMVKDAMMIGYDFYKKMGWVD